MNVDFIDICCLAYCSSSPLVSCSQIVQFAVAWTCRRYWKWNITSESQTLPFIVLKGQFVPNSGKMKNGWRREDQAALERHPKKHLDKEKNLFSLWPKWMTSFQAISKVQVFDRATVKASRSRPTFPLSIDRQAQKRGNLCGHTSWWKGGLFPADSKSWVKGGRNCI